MQPSDPSVKFTLSIYVFLVFFILINYMIKSILSIRLRSLKSSSVVGLLSDRKRPLVYLPQNQFFVSFQILIPIQSLFLIYVIQYKIKE